MLNRSQEFSGRSLKALVVSTVLFILGGWGCSQKRIVPETSIDQRKPERQESVMAQNLSERARVVFLGPQGEGWSVNVEVARSPSQRARGLMGRKEMANDEGMLFVFGRLDRHSFYMKNNNLRITLSLVLLVSFMLFLSFAAVPLYKLFCQVTGYGGTPKIVNVEDEIEISERKIKIEFNSDINKKLNWSFKPEQRSIESKIGESILAFYKAKNNGKKSITGIATYNVLPFEAAKYFNKVDCFCFENQTLEPGEEVLLPVNFYIDPEILNDPGIKHLNSIVLSYTFFQSEENFEKISKNNN